MRLLLILMLFAPGLFALDLKDVDRDTCRYVRLALLKDDVRKHFGLRIGDFESLDQALRVDVEMGGASHLLVLRLGTKAAAVLILTDGKSDKAGEHCFIEVENALTAAAILDTSLATLDCRLGDSALPVRSRLLRCQDGKLQVCFTWIRNEQLSLEKDRYTIETTRRIDQSDSGIRLVEETRYLLDGKQVDGGVESGTTELTDGEAGYSRGTVVESTIPLATHCAIARRLERDGLNDAALHHARAAKLRATLDNLADDDSRRLEAQALTARLEARLRRVEITRR
ncbi:MAG: hypothetical protein KDB90_14350 [Planctomycetes bacterium]|nr:hypothetical protein [Planctomycetota bacterium]